MWTATSRPRFGSATSLLLKVGEIFTGNLKRQTSSPNPPSPGSRPWAGRSCAPLSVAASCYLARHPIRKSVVLTVRDGSTYHKPNKTQETKLLMHPEESPFLFGLHDVNLEALYWAGNAFAVGEKMVRLCGKMLVTRRDLRCAARRARPEATNRK